MDSKYLIWIIVGLIVLGVLKNEGIGPDGSVTPVKVGILLVHETEDSYRMPESQRDILFGEEFVQWAKVHCDQDENGNLEFRVLDKDADVSKLSKKWQDAFAKAKASKLPYIILSTGKGGFFGDLPLSTKDLMPYAKKYGGE